MAPTPIMIPNDGPLGVASRPPADLGPLPQVPESAVLMLMGAVALCTTLQPDGRHAARDCLAVAAALTGCPHAGPLNALVRVAGVRLALATRDARPEVMTEALIGDGEILRIIAGVDQHLATCRDHWEAGPCAR
jgi:hypothetical protein